MWLQLNMTCYCILNFSKQIGHTQFEISSLFNDYSSIYYHSSCWRGLGGDGTNPNFYANDSYFEFIFGNLNSYLLKWSWSAAELMQKLSYFLYFFII